MAQTQALGTLEAATPPAMAAASPAAMRCRVCGSAAVTSVGRAEFYSGFPAPIWDCRNCGCRFTKDFPPVHDVLHTKASSSYSLYRDMAKTSKKYFDHGDLQRLRDSVGVHRKYTFVLDAIDKMPKQTSILEVGCSRGHMTSYFILSGRKILATDISPHAVKAAERDFGKYFALADSSIIAERAPYDVIFHIGTIGCVSDPIGFTRSLLDLLRPGGRLLFNWPNAAACWLDGQLWINGAYPPGTLTLFREGFWARHFAEEAEVVETVEPCTPAQSALIAVEQFAGQKWTVPQPVPIEAGIDDLRGDRGEPKTALWLNIARLIRRLPKSLLRHAPTRPDPSSLATMTKK